MMGAGADAQALSSTAAEAAAAAIAAAGRALQLAVRGHPGRSRVLEQLEHARGGRHEAVDAAGRSWWLQGAVVVQGQHGQDGRRSRRMPAHEAPQQPASGACPNSGTPACPPLVVIAHHCDPPAAACQQHGNVHLEQVAATGLFLTVLRREGGRPVTGGPREGAGKSSAGSLRRSNYATRRCRMQSPPLVSPRRFRR